MSAISLSELERVQRAAADAKLSAEAAQLIAEQRAIDAAPVLIEIAGAALAYRDNKGSPAALFALEDALRKVMP